MEEIWQYGEEECDECGFMDPNAHCLYNECPNSSPTVCQGCDLLREDPNGNIARCTRKREIPT